jgi:hypothetical protein
MKTKAFISAFPRQKPPVQRPETVAKAGLKKPLNQATHDFVRPHAQSLLHFSASQHRIRLALENPLALMQSSSQ